MISNFGASFVKVIFCEICIKGTFIKKLDILQTIEIFGFGNRFMVRAIEALQSLHLPCIVGLYLVCINFGEQWHYGRGGV